MADGTGLAGRGGTSSNLDSVEPLREDGPLTTHIIEVSQVDSTAAAVALWRRPIRAVFTAA